LDRLGPSDSLVLVVKDSVVGRDEDVSQDVQWSDWWWDIHSHESRKALNLVSAGDLKNVILWSQSEGVSVDDEGDVWQSLDDVTGLEDSFSIDDSGSEGLVEGVDVRGWSSEEGSSGITDGLAWLAG
jgi:hypothetical protein